jgi:fructose-1-phosphate kinase PfkB-like protein
MPNEARVIALDLSATFGEGIRGALVGADATVLASRQSMVPTAENDLLNVIVTMAGRLADQAAREGPAAAAIALAVPGMVDEVVGAGSALVAGLRTRLEQKINLVAPPQVRTASLGDAAAVMGAAAVAFERAGIAAVTEGWRALSTVPSLHLE